MKITFFNNRFSTLKDLHGMSQNADQLAKKVRAAAERIEQNDAEKFSRQAMTIVRQSSLPGLNSKYSEPRLRLFSRYRTGTATPACPNNSFSNLQMTNAERAALKMTDADLARLKI